MAADLTTLAAVREFLKVEAGDTEDDALFSSLISRISELVQDHIGRSLVGDAGTNPLTVHLNGQGTQFVQVKAYPAANFTSVKQSRDQDWAGADELVTECIIDEPLGIVKYKDSIFFPGFRNVQVIHDQTTTLNSGTEQKIIEMVSKLYQEKDNLGITSLSLKDGSMTKNARIGALFAENLSELSHLINYGSVL